MRTEHKAYTNQIWKLSDNSHSLIVTGCYSPQLMNALFCENVGMCLTSLLIIFPKFFQDAVSKVCFQFYLFKHSAAVIKVNCLLLNLLSEMLK